METKKDNLKKVKDNQADEPPLSETECKNASDDALPSETAEKSKEKAKSEKNNKPQDIVLEEESLDVSKETENILEVKDKLVAKDDVSKNTAIEAIEIDRNGKSL